MLKKIILAGSFAIALFWSINTNAQSLTGGTFNITYDTVTATTSGTVPPPSNDANHYVDMHNAMTNTSSSPITFGWKFLVNESTIPEGWDVPGFCDNGGCYNKNGHWDNGEEQVTNNTTLDPQGFGTLWLHFAAPEGSADGVGIVKFQIRTLDQTDTITFILTKQPTGVSIINQNDARVKIYPNPAASYLTVSADPSLNPKNISILNVEGRQMSATGIQAGSKETNMDISSLASGMYMVRITDTDGKVITSRKFTKQ